MKKVIRLFILILALTMGIVNFAIATHSFTTEIFYRWKPMVNSDSTYEFTVIFERNCSGITGGAPGSIALTSSSSTLGSTSITNLAQLPATGPTVPPLQPPGIYNCLFGSSTLCIEEYYYRGDWTSPGRADDWIFSVVNCSRPNNPSSANINNGCMWVECGLNNLDFPDSTSQNWSPIFHNRRPNHPGYLNDVIFNHMLKTLCEGQLYFLDESAKEYQGDSLHYSFYWPQDAGGAQISYVNGFTFTQPFPTNNGIPVINTTTGIIEVIAGSPSSSGYYLVGIEASEYRNDTTWNGQIMSIQPKRIGYVRREIMVKISAATICSGLNVKVKNRSMVNMNSDSTVDVYFHTGITGYPNSYVKCNTLSPDGSEFSVLDSSTYIFPYDSTIRKIEVLSASWTCLAGVWTDKITLKLAEPISCGNFSILLKLGIDSNVIETECGVWLPAGTIGELYTNKNTYVDIGKDTVVCRNEPFSLTLKAQAGYRNYLWSSSDTGKSITVSDTGIHWVEVTNNFLCIGSDTILISTRNCDTINNDTVGNGIGMAITSKIHMYPNPSTGVIYIALPDSKGHEKLSLFDVNGRVVFQLILERSTNVVELNPHNVRSGIYFLKLTRNGEVLLQEKLILSVNH